MYAFGYVRFYEDYKNNKGVEVYDFSSDSWRLLDVKPDYVELFDHRGVTLKGINAYFLLKEYDEEYDEETYPILAYLVRFDFKTERFGQHLPLPYPSLDTPTQIFEARDEKLAVLYETSYDEIEIWITTKIEPNAASWSIFLRRDMRLINGLPPTLLTDLEFSSFFIDEEKRVVVIFAEDNKYHTAHIIGEDGYFKSVNMGKARKRWDSFQLVCSSYVPSLVQLQINQPGKSKGSKRKRRDQAKEQNQPTMPKERKKTKR